MTSNNPAGEKDLYNYDKSKFDHAFSGWSVWIEPEETPELSENMEYLRQACGGEACGVAPFVPHVTMLYNIKQFENPLDVMEECLNQYQSNQESKQPNVVHLQRKRETTNENSDEEENANGMSQPTISPCNWYYLHYPKYSDNGNGFGCSISLLHIETSRWLEELQQACQEILGPDERRKFIPHVSMVYAPEEQEAFLQAYTREQQNLQTFLNQPFRAKYLSLWSTQGRLQDWYRIAKVPLAK